MWVGWLGFVVLAILMAVYLPHRSPVEIRKFDLFTIGIFVFPIAICTGLWVWTDRIGHPWLRLLPYFLGVFFALQASLYGVLLLPNLLQPFQILGAILFLSYLPILIRK